MSNCMKLSACSTVNSHANCGRSRLLDLALCSSRCSTMSGWRGRHSKRRPGFDEFNALGRIVRGDRGVVRVARIHVGAWPLDDAGNHLGDLPMAQAGKRQ